MCALAGRLGQGRAAWKHIPQLPFELAACPHQWFQWLRLPVVSYALPALIAIGQVRHQRHPTCNPLARVLRALARQRTLDLLQTIQPSSGGFLEATPLTSFVVMSLIGSGQIEHPVVRQGIEFLVRSARPDGSWAIDSDLATWLTTLSINALAASPRFTSILPEPDRRRVCDWLLGQQYRVEHPYTHAAPGGWAWTDLPGGVPDADDTAGALLALWNLGFRDSEVLRAVTEGTIWLLDLQNRDGGIPTFCRGWGTLPFDRSGTDLTAHALRAWSIWRELLPPALNARCDQATRHGLKYLAAQQRDDGSWLPLWFGNQWTPDDSNPTYGTARVVAALRSLDTARLPGASEMKDRAIRWLLEAQNPDGSWGGAAGIQGSLEETALAMSALVPHPDHRIGSDDRTRHAIQRSRAWLWATSHNGEEFPASPIGFYFARLWYFERLYPLIFTTGAMADADRAAS